MTSKNRVYNGNFEITNSGWSLMAGISFSASSPHSGTGCLRFVGTAGGSYPSDSVKANAAQNFYGVRPYDPVTLNYWGFRESGDMAFIIRVYWYKKDKVTPASTPNVDVVWAGANGAWALRAATLNAPADAYWCFLRAYLYSGTVASAFRLDDVTLTTPRAQWPEELPNPDYGLSESEVEGMIIRSSNDSGIAKQRLRYTAVSVPITANLTLSRAQAAIFRDFLANEIKYVLSFDWNDMMTDDNVRTYRFTKRPAFSRAGFDQVTVALNMEMMP